MSLMRVEEKERKRGEKKMGEKKIRAEDRI
jgi:hypothetical protein